MCSSSLVKWISHTPFCYSCLHGKLRGRGHPFAQSQRGHEHYISRACCRPCRHSGLPLVRSAELVHAVSFLTSAGALPVTRSRRSPPHSLQIKQQHWTCGVVKPSHRSKGAHQLRPSYSQHNRGRGSGRSRPRGWVWSARPHGNLRFVRCFALFRLMSSLP